jgi:hypothetical protein
MALSDPFQGDFDAFVVKLNSNGALQWLTFLGGDSTDSGLGITVDSSGNVYVVGSSYCSWGSPVRPHAGPGKTDAFVAKLNSSGAIQWSTFLSGGEHGSAWGIARDSLNGEIYVVGISAGSWGPVTRGTNEFTFAAKLNSSGVLQTNAFFGGSGSDGASVIGLDASGNMAVSRASNLSWGSPIRAYSAGFDAFVVKLPAFGNRVGQSFGPVSPAPNLINIGDTAQVFTTPTSRLPVRVTVSAPCGV